ncbi:hypothetical protein [Spirosoma arcticum]
MKLLLLFGMAVLTLSRCTQSTALTPEAASTDGVIIRTGTSFGMCVGYCQNDYVFDGTRVTLTQNGTRTQAQSPTKTCQTTLSAADGEALRALTNFDAFSSKPATLGCPDCADGGAEYIELQTGDRTHRVTFEFGKTIPGFEPLVNALRRQREAFNECK